MTQVIEAGTYAILDALHRYYEAHPRAERPVGYTPQRDPPRDLASLLATRPQQQAAMKLLAPLLVADGAESDAVSEALETLARLG